MLIFLPHASAKLPALLLPMQESHEVTGPCPLIVWIDRKGRVYDSRFGGRYRVSPALLRMDLLGGCKERGLTSSITIQIESGAPPRAMDDLLVAVHNTVPRTPLKVVHSPTPRAR